MVVHSCTHILREATKKEKRGSRQGSIVRLPATALIREKGTHPTLSPPKHQKAVGALDQVIYSGPVQVWMASVGSFLLATLPTYSRDNAPSLGRARTTY